MRSQVIGAVLLSLVCAGSAWAKDSIDVTASNFTGSPKPVVVNNGQAVGTIQLIYTVNATGFPVGAFATFDVNWLLSQDPQKPTDYGSGQTFSLTQDQQGGHVDLVPSPDTFRLTAAGQSGSSKVTVYIAPDKAGNLPASADGTDLVGNLKLDAGSKVGTVTNIQVHIRLVHPTGCVKAYTFVTDQDYSMGILSTTSLKVGTNGPKAGKVISSTPGQFSDNVLIVNTCAIDQSFDLGIGLDSSFSTSPSDNPGNAVVTYTAAGEFDSTNFNPIMAASGTARGQNLCLQNVTVPAGTTLLATVHSKVKDNWPQAYLPLDGSFDFTASVYQNVNAGCSLPLDSQVSPNPATFVLPFTIRSN